MKTESVRKATIVAVGASVASLYVYFLASFLANRTLYPQTTIEMIVLLSQFMKVLAVISLKKLRYLSFSELYMLFSLEILSLILPLEIISVLIWNDLYWQFIGEVCFSWLSSLTLLIPPYAIFRLVSGMYKGVSLSSTLSSAISQFDFMLVMVNLLANPTISPENFSGLTKSLLDQASKGSPMSGTGNLPFTANIIGTVSSVTIYLALLAYSPLCTRKSDEMMPPTMLMPLLMSTIVLLAWVLLAMMFTTSALLVLTVPAVVLTFALWWFTRE